MEVLNVIRGRAVWLFTLDELNPQGKSFQRGELIHWLNENYHFETSPDATQKQDPNMGLVFANGKFQIREDFFITVNLTFYNDGVIAETLSSTRDTDKFLDDLLERGIKDFGLIHRPNLIRRKLYVSELNLRSDKSLNSLNNRFKDFTRRITELIPDVRNVPFEASSIGFSPRPGASLFTVADFRFERKLGSGFEENRYFSTAPLHTDDHIALLNEFEQFLVR